MQNTIEQYREYMAAQRYSPRTIDTYADAVALLVPEPETCTAADLTAALAVRATSAGSRNLYAYSLRNFFAWLQDTGRRTDNPAADIKNVRTPPAKQGDVLTKSQWKKLVAAATSPRDKALLYLLAGCGLRISEALSLTKSDIRGNTVTVQCGKGGKQRAVDMPKATAKAVREYIRKKESAKSGEIRGCSSSELLFPITRQRAHSILKAVAKRAGIKARVHLHMLRRCYATWCIEENVDLITLSHTMGHSDISTTRRYVRITDKRRAAAAASLSGIV